MRFLFLAAVVLTAGLIRGEAASTSPNAYLTALHVHGSLSEGTSTMLNHVEQAELGGFDGVWFTDHMTRQATWGYPLVVPLDGSLQGSPLPAPISQSSVQLLQGGANPNILTLSYSSSSPAVGTKNLRVKAKTTAQSGNGYRWSTLEVKGFDRSQRLSMLAEPELSAWVRLTHLSGTAGFAIRMKLSGVQNGTEDGELRSLELLPNNFTAPAPQPGVVRLAIQSLPMNQWTQISVKPHQYAALFPGGSMDMSLIEAELIFYSRQGGEVRVDLDHITLARSGLAEASMYQGARAVLDAMPPSPVFTKVGAEVDGPWDQQILSTSSRDHLIALFPGTTPVYYPFNAGTPAALNYPQSGVDLIHQSGGAAILGHIFGAAQNSNTTISTGTMNTLADRVVQNEAWSADGIEIGYPHRGRPIEDFVAVWDDLSDDEVYITGIGSSDQHSMLPWAQWNNRWGTWIVAPNDGDQELVDAVKAGDCFFGDPYRLDPDGMLYIEDDSGRYRMGDVVPDITNGREDLRITVAGALNNSTVKVISNGSVIETRTVGSSGATSFVKKKKMNAGDWVRVELRDNQGRLYAMSNPIYFIHQNATPPAHRAP